MDQQFKNSAFSYGAFNWWYGVIEDRNDPEKLGRYRVRVYGYHSPKTSDIAPDKLFWAIPVMPINGASMSGVGVSPTGALEGSWCFGFFADGSNAQMPMLLGTFPGKPEKKKPTDEGDGFSDPNGLYPKDDWLGEQDVHRIARNEKISETNIQYQRDDEDKAVPDAIFGETWDEKPTEYDALYPYCHVKETERGHTEEWDDTEGKQRYRRWHPYQDQGKIGNFVEVHPDNSEVHKIQNDKYEIICGDDYVHVKGSVRITVDGNAYILTKGDVNMETKGDYNHYVHGNYQLKVGGTFKQRSGGTNWTDAPQIHLNLPGPAITFSKPSDPKTGTK